jgi:hypothetical protein
LLAASDAAHVLLLLLIITITTMLLFRSFILLLLVTIAVAVDTTETCDANDGTCTGDGSFQTNKNDCVDTEDRCAFWANSGECKDNPGYMIRNCMKSCNVCHTGKTIEELIAEQQKEREENVT